MDDVKTFEDLDVWKRGCSLTVDIHMALAESKDFALRGQMERSSLSIPSNIAEGAERDTTPEFIKFLRYSKGSCGELRTQLHISERIRNHLGAPPMDGSKQMIQESRELSKNAPRPHQLPKTPHRIKPHQPRFNQAPHTTNLSH
jgi:four helix bundle protein